MPSFQPFIQRAGDKSTTITAVKTLGGAMAERLRQSGVNPDVKLRRQQRWLFYAIFVVLFLAGLIFVLKVYADNTKLVGDVDNLNATLTQKNHDLEQVRSQLAERNQAAEAAAGSLSQLQQELAKNVSDLEVATAKNKDYETQLSQQGDSAGQDKLSLERAKANTLNLILTLGTELTGADLNKIPFADVTVAGTDTDKDGLSDDLEAALSTDPLKPDTDNDGYSDKEEIVGGFNPLGQGVFNADSKFAVKYRGRIVLNRRGDSWYAWYVSQDAKRYYLGSSDNKFEALRQSDYWTKDQTSAQQ